MPTRFLSPAVFPPLLHEPTVPLERNGSFLHPQAASWLPARHRYVPSHLGSDTTMSGIILNSRTGRGIQHIALLISAVTFFSLTAWPTAAFAQIGAAAERAAGRAAMTAAERQAANSAAKEAAGAVSRRSATASADRVVTRWSASLCKPASPCPLPEKVAVTFNGGSYNELILGKDTVLYRVFHAPKFKFGDSTKSLSYWSRSDARGTQAAIDSAIDVSSRGNTAERLAAIRVPKGTRVFEGETRAAGGRYGSPERGPVGGGNQVVVEDVKPTWEITLEEARMLR